MATEPTFYEILTAAIADIAEHGFTSAQRIAEWQDKLSRAALRMIGTPDKVEALMRDAMEAVYRRMVEQGGWMKYHSGVTRFTIDRVIPQLRSELDRRVWSNIDLIKLNRQQAMAETARRFSGWASSVPPGGAAEVNRRELKERVGKPLTGLPFIERRCAIDQGHKLAAAINETIAKGGDAIAGIWRHHHSNNPRHKHVERDGRVFLMRDSWALKQGLVKPAGPDGYIDSVERVGEFVYCRCTMTYIYGLRSVPENMLTAKGKAELERVRIA